MSEVSETSWYKKFLLPGLIVSLSLNVGLTASLLYNRSSPLPTEEGIAVLPSKRIEAGKEIGALLTRSFEELAALLSDTTYLEQGYRLRDFALGCLVSFHYFDIDRALGAPPEKQVFTLHLSDADEVTLPLFPLLKEGDFTLLRDFIRREQWPLTPIGLFLEIKNGSQLKESLIKAFSLTKEYNAISTVFALSIGRFPDEWLIQMVRELDWKTIDAATKFIETSGFPPEEQLGELCLFFSKKGSILATLFLITYTPEYPIKKLEHQELMAVIRKLESNSEHVQSFLRTVAKSSRPNEVKLLAVHKGYELRNELIPQDLSSKELIDAFASAVPLQEVRSETQSNVHAKVEQNIYTQIPLEEGVYVVEDGDTLWKIARKFHVSVEELRSYNQLRVGEYLKVGMRLKIPPSKPSA